MPDERPVDFDEHAADYSRQVDSAVAFSGQSHGFFLDVKARLIEGLLERHFSRRARVRLLEAGSGPGLIQSRLRRDLIEPWAFDLSLTSLAQARQVRSSRRQLAADGRCTPFPDATFDVVLAVCVLHHVPAEQRPAFVGEMARLTRPGGLTMVCEHNPSNPLTRRAVAHCPFDRDAVLLPKRETERRLRAAGLSGVRSRYFLFLPLDARFWQTIERALAPLPLGAQYVSLGIRP